MTVMNQNHSGTFQVGSDNTVRDLLQSTGVYAGEDVREVMITCSDENSEAFGSISESMEKLPSLQWCPHYSLRRVLQLPYAASCETCSCRDARHHSPQIWIRNVSNKGEKIKTKSRRRLSMKLRVCFIYWQDWWLNQGEGWRYAFWTSQISNFRMEPF